MSLGPEFVKYADEHSELLEAISRLDDAPAALKNKTRYLADLNEGIKQKEERLKKLVKKREAEHKDYDVFKHNKMKRFFIRVSKGGEGLAQKVEKEEKEYFEAAHEEFLENQAISELQDAIKIAEEEKATLEEQVADRQTLSTRLDDLYRTAFTGHSPDFPEEDAAEEDLERAEQYYIEVQAQHDHEKQVHRILEQALKVSQAALVALRQSSRMAQYDTIGFMDFYSQTQESEYLIQAQFLISKAEGFLHQARSLQPSVKSFPAGIVIQPEWLNVVFDNVYNDYLYQQKVEKSVRSVLAYCQAIEYELNASHVRTNSTTQVVRDAKDFLRSRRLELTAVRREIFKRVAEDMKDMPPGYLSNPSDAAPGYQSPSAGPSAPPAFPFGPSQSRDLGAPSSSAGGSSQISRTPSMAFPTPGQGGSSSPPRSPGIASSPWSFVAMTDSLPENQAPSGERPLPPPMLFPDVQVGPTHSGSSGQSGSPHPPRFPEFPGMPLAPGDASSQRYAPPPGPPPPLKSSASLSVRPTSGPASPGGSTSNQSSPGWPTSPGTVGELASARHASSRPRSPSQSSAAVQPPSRDSVALSDLPPPPSYEASSRPTTPSRTNPTPQTEGTSYTDVKGRLSPSSSSFPAFPTGPSPNMSAGPAGTSAGSSSSAIPGPSSSSSALPPSMSRHSASLTASLLKPNDPASAPQLQEANAESISGMKPKSTNPFRRT
ncbi:hypothetical protein BD410DRAFT_398652 [Rickenella mellea]|uniref:Uncharacterized protein n=1 Tax=Rickenella mellea TaxID=50990 RepID=A0A4Y7PWS3_9AGAM|nr:hypothetical protein BD410DRAFT_398652 [Rickenella mellea]